MSGILGRVSDLPVGSCESSAFVFSVAERDDLALKFLLSWGRETIVGVEESHSVGDPPRNAEILIEYARRWAEAVLRARRSAEVACMGGPTT